MIFHLAMTRIYGDRRLSGFQPWLVASLAALVQTGCLVAPAHYSLEFPESGTARCAQSVIPGGWTFEGATLTGGEVVPARMTYEVRLPRRPDEILIAGVIQQGEDVRFSREIYRVSPVSPPGKVAQHEWSGAASASLVRKSVAQGPPQPGIAEPAFALGQHEYLLPGNMFWNSPNASRINESGRMVLAMSYSQRQGIVRPKSYAQFEVFSTGTGRRIWSARGEGPILAPLAQFGAVAWIGDRILFMPHNRAATRFDVCWFAPAIAGS